MSKLISILPGAPEMAPDLISAPLGANQPLLPLPVKARLQIHRLVHDLFVAPSLLPPRVVAFTAIEEEGHASSWVCAHAGDTLAAAQSASVCLVDADFHSARLHAHLQVRNAAGFTDLLHEPKKAAADYAVHAAERLWLLSAGTRPRQGTEALAANAAQARLNDLRTRFQYVLISSPPVADDGVAAVIGRSTDGIVLVLRAGSTRRDVARKAKDEFEALGVRVLAAILLDPDAMPAGSITTPAQRA